VKGFNGLRKAKAMRDQRLEVDETTRDEADRFGILTVSDSPSTRTYLMRVSVLKLKVDLVGRQVAKRKL
jgi:hypothetical protein